MKKVLTIMVLSIYMIILSPITLAANSTPSFATTNDPAVYGGINVAGGIDLPQNRHDNIIQVSRNIANYGLGVAGLIALASGDIDRVIKVGIGRLGVSFVFYTISLAAK